MKEIFKKMRIASKNTLRFLGLVSLPLVAATVMKAIACLTDLNYATGYFELGVLSTISAYIVAAICIASFSYLFISKGQVPVSKPSGPLSFVPAGLSSVAALFLSAELFSELFGSLSGEEIGISAPLTLALAITSLLAAVAFFLIIYYEHREDTRKAAYGIAAAIFFAAYAAYLYFDNSTPLNSPSKIADQMAYLASAAFFLYETRISLGRSHWRSHTAFGIMAAAVSLYASVPALVVFFAKGILITKSLASTVLVLALGLFALARVILFSTSDVEEEPSTVRTVRILAKNRIEELNAGITHERSRGVAEDGQIGENYEIKIPSENEASSTENKEESAE